NQSRTAELQQHAIKCACVLLLGIDRAARNTLAIAVAVDLEGGGLARADQRRDPLPFGIRPKQDLLGLLGGIEKAVDCLAVRRRPCFIEDITDHRQRTGNAEIWQQVVYADESAETAR